MKYEEASTQDLMMTMTGEDVRKYSREYSALCRKICVLDMPVEAVKKRLGRQDHCWTGGSQNWLVGLVLLGMGCATTTLPKAELDVTFPAEWAWYGPTPCSYEVIAFIDGTTWTRGEAIEIMEALVATEADRILEPRIEKERIAIYPANCDDTDIPSCFDAPEYGSLWHAYVLRWNISGTAIRWVRELCGGWPDTIIAPEGQWMPVEGSLGAEPGTTKAEEVSDE